MYAGRVVDFVFLHDNPMPITIPPPNKIGLITADSTARITWESPILLPFQGNFFKTWQSTFFTANQSLYFYGKCPEIRPYNEGSIIYRFLEISTKA